MKNNTKKKNNIKIISFILVALFIGILAVACNSEETEDDFETLYSCALESEIDSNESLGEKNALRSAKSYIDIMGFSYSGLISQLKYDGYSDDEAKYGADNCGADWKKEAAQSAQNYLDVMGMSRSDLYSQLEYDGYTSDQIEYALIEVGY